MSWSPEIMSFLRLFRKRVPQLVPPLPWDPQALNSRVYWHKLSVEEYELSSILGTELGAPVSSLPIITPADLPPESPGFVWELRRETALGEATRHAAGEDSSAEDGNSGELSEHESLPANESNESNEIIETEVEQPVQSQEQSAETAVQPEPLPTTSESGQLKLAHDHSQHAANDQLDFDAVDLKAPVVGQEPLAGSDGEVARNPISISTPPAQPQQQPPALIPPTEVVNAEQSKQGGVVSLTLLENTPIEGKPAAPTTLHDSPLQTLVENSDQDLPTPQAPSTKVDAQVVTTAEEGEPAVAAVESAPVAGIPGASSAAVSVAMSAPQKAGEKPQATPIATAATTPADASNEVSSATAVKTVANERLPQTTDSQPLAGPSNEPAKETPLDKSPAKLVGESPVSGTELPEQNTAQGRAPSPEQPPLERFPLDSGNAVEKPVSFIVAPGREVLGGANPSANPGPAPSVAAAGTAVAETPLSQAPSVKEVVAAETVLRDVPITRLAERMDEVLSHSLRMRSLRDHWTVDLRLDPPELGSIRIQLEMRGQTIQGTVHYANPRLDDALERMLPELESKLREDGGDASLELFQESPRRQFGNDEGSPNELVSDNESSKTSTEILLESDHLVDFTA